MRPGIRLKLFLFSLGLIVISIVAAEVYLSAALGRQLTQRIQEDLLTRARMVARDVAERMPTLSDARAADALADEIAAVSAMRVTLVRLDGTVAGDSEVATEALARLDNHGARPEVVAALAVGQGSSTRFSETTERLTLYLAVPVTSGGAASAVARISVPLTHVEEALAEMRKSLGLGALVALAIAVAISLSAAELTSRKLRDLTAVAREIASGNLRSRARLVGHDEISALGAALDQLADSLSRSLDELRGERDLLTGILSSMNEGVLVVGADGRVLLTNPALRAMLLIGGDAVGKPVLQVIRNAELNQLLETASRARAAELELELSGLRPRRALVRAVSLEDEPGSVLAVFVDVTELRRLEAVRRDFVANASHELRSPLTTVRAAAETLAAGDNDPHATARFIQLIQRNAERLAHLIDDLLELSRIESRELKLELEAVELAPMFERTIAQHAHRAQVKGIELSADAGGAPSVRADRRALDHVLGNLVDNALKYCPAGASVRVSAVAGEGAVTVSVADSGPGIPAEHLPRLFERFYRVDAGRSRELGGTGLGLSIVKHLVESMDGKVAVESRPGAGSIFSFTLRSA